jgi:endonuclease-3
MGSKTPVQRSGAPERRRLLAAILAQLYPEPRSELVFVGEYQLVTAVILSAQCTDRKVNEVTAVLFKAYPDFAALARARRTAVERIIRPVNYYATKAKNIIAMGTMVVERFGGALPRTHGELIMLPGVGNKTANVVLGELGITPAFPVDTHVKRLANRLGLSNARVPDKVEADLKRLFPPDSWRNLHHRLIFHGRRVCAAQRPRCGECALGELCPSRRTDG